MHRHTELLATGVYLPERELTNDALAASLSEEGRASVAKYAAASGIVRRFVAEEGVATSELAARAAKVALERAGVSAEQLDLIVVGTDTPDYITPATSVVLQHRLQATNAGTFDVGCACASFPTALASVAGIIAASPGVDLALVVGAYRMSALAGAEDPARFFYGDGAGAAVVRRSAAPGFLASAFRADGSYAQRWGVFSGGTVEPASEESVREGRTRVQLLHGYPPQVNDEGWPLLTRQVVERAGLTLADIDHFVFTQVRRPTIEGVMRTLDVPIGRAPMIMERVGYTGSACIPMALDDALARGVIRVGQHVAMVGSGVGFNQAAAVVRITEALAGAVS